MDWLLFSRKLLHDFASPILGMRLQLWSFSQEDPDNVHKEFVENMETELNRLEQLLERSRSIMRLQKPLEPKPLTKGNCQEILDELTQEFPDLSLQVNVEHFLPTNLPVDFFKIIFTNLTENAVDAGATFVVWTKVGETIIFQDNGPGFNEKALKEGLVPFWSSRANHLGLGLTEASRILDLFGGQLELVSDAKNRVKLIWPYSES
ncbi:MAG: HAMP domain-containing sensor histidine kinase [Verrucomicrobiota bacterium]